MEKKQLPGYLFTFTIISEVLTTVASLETGGVAVTRLGSVDGSGLKASDDARLVLSLTT